MRPVTALQRRVVDASKRYPSLNDDRKTQAFEGVVPRTAKYTKTTKTMHCLICGHSWKADNADEVTCPVCGKVLNVDHSAKRNFKNAYYVSFSDAFEGFQVVSVALVKVNQVKGKAMEFSMGVAFQRWIDERGHSEIIARKRCMSYYCDIWDWSTPLELRSVSYHNSYSYTVHPYVAFNADSVIEKLRRNGFDGDFHDNNPNYILSDLLTSPQYETLWKAGYYELASKDLREIDRVWPSIRIAIRNHFPVNDPSLWLDYLRDLEILDKDLRNAKYVCPQDLRAEHQKTQELVRNKQRREERARELERHAYNAEKLAEDENNYQQFMSKYFSLCFTDEELTVRPLKSVKEFCEEGKEMHHCVYVNKYYQKQDSLIMTATNKGERVATVEFSLSELKILQCRGKYNSDPDDKEHINSLIMGHLNEIAKLATA